MRPLAIIFFLALPVAGSGAAVLVAAWACLILATQRQNHARCRRGEGDGVVSHAVYVNHGRSRNHG